MKHLFRFFCSGRAGVSSAAASATTAAATAAPAAPSTLAPPPIIGPPALKDATAGALDVDLTATPPTADAATGGCELDATRGEELDDAPTSAAVAVAVTGATAVTTAGVAGGVVELVVAPREDEDAFSSGLVCGSSSIAFASGGKAVAFTAALHADIGIWTWEYIEHGLKSASGVGVRGDRSIDDEIVRCCRVT